MSLRLSRQIFDAPPSLSREKDRTKASFKCTCPLSSHSAHTWRNSFMSTNLLGKDMTIFEANFPRLDYLGYCKRRVEASDLPVSMSVCSLVRFEVCFRRTWSRCLVFTIGAIARLVSQSGELCLFYGLTRC